MKISLLVGALRQKARLRSINNFLQSFEITEIEKDGTTAIWAAPRIKTNVGDRALVQGAVAGLGENSTLLLTRDPGFMGLSANHEVKLSPDLVSGSAKKFKSAFQQLAKDVSSCEKFIMIGADIMDGKYSPEGSWRRWKVAEWMKIHLGEAAVISMSWNENPEPLALAGASEANLTGVKIFCRDEISMSRLLNSKVDSTLAADVSFTKVEKLPPSDEVVSWLANGKKNIIVNVSDWVIRDNSMQDLLVDALTRIDKSEFQFLYVPMVTDGGSTDYESCSQLSKLVGGHVLSYLPDPGELRWIAGASIFGISARMHCCLLGFAAGMPSIGIEYQGKFRGTFRAFGLERFAISPDKFIEEFPNRVNEIMNNYESIRADIESKVEQMSESARTALLSK